MWTGFSDWRIDHNVDRRLDLAGNIVLCVIGLTWPFLLLAFGVNVFDSSWYWLSAWL